MATSTHDGDMVIGDIIISPSGPHYFKRIIYFKNDWCGKIRKQTNGRQIEKVEIPSLSFGQSYSTSGWKILFTF